MTGSRNGYGRGMVVGVLMMMAGVAFGVVSAAVIGARMRIRRELRSGPRLL